MQAMILAAGFGTRLQPYTNVKPKPLFPILNKPLLLLTIERLKKSGFKKIIVNCHHLSEQIVERVSNIPEVIIQEEETILGTGGGLRRALDKLSNEPLLIVNGDIYHTVPYQEVYSFHCTSDRPVTMALHDLPRFNTVNVVDNCVTGFNGNDTEKLAFTGIHIIEPEILNRLETDSFSCIIDLYKTLILNDLEIGIYRADKAFWSDMGTPEDYLDLHNNLFAGEVPIYDELESLTSNVLVGEKTDFPSGSKITDWACIGENVHFDENVQLTRTIVWDNAHLEGGKEYIDTIVTGY